MPNPENPTPTEAPARSGDTVAYAIVPTAADATGRAAQIAATPQPATPQPASPKKPELPEILRNATAKEKMLRPGPCIWMLFKLDLGVPSTQTVLKEIELAGQNSNYDIKWLTNGFVRIIGTAERATNSLLNIAQSLQDDPTRKIYMGQGQISYPKPEKYTLTGQPNLPEINEWEDTEAPGIYLTRELVETLGDPNSREMSHFELEVGPSKSDKLAKLIEYRAKVSEHIGGPDIFIGCESELDEIEAFLKSNYTRLAFIKGSAGIGKSRIILETISKLAVNNILCSLDAADKNLQGASLVTLADQLATIISDDPILGDGQGGRTRLVGFQALGHADKITLAQMNPDDLTRMCIEALEVIEFTKGSKSVLIIEDLHSADRLSQQWITKIARAYIQNSNGDNKAVFTMRPEQMYESRAQADVSHSIEGEYGEDSVETIELQGIDFENGKTTEGQSYSYMYAYHMIPRDLRKGRTLGNWHEVLGKIAGKSPFIMGTLVSSILEDPNNYVVTDEAINVKSDVLQKIAQIKPDDSSALATHIHERIRALPVKTRQILQAIAITGGRSDTGQLHEIIRGITNGSTQDLKDTINRLRLGGYVRYEKDQKTGEVSVIFQHELMKDFVLSSMVDPEEKAAMAKFMYQLIGRNPRTTPDTKLSILTHIATAPNPPSKEQSDFWNAFSSAANNTFADAERNNATRKTYNIAKSMIDKVEGSATLSSALEDLTKGREVPANITALVVQVLMKLAATALPTGKFQEAKDAIANLKKIAEQQEGIIDSPAVTLMDFERAYRERNKADMRRIFNDEISKNNKIPTATRAIIGIKLAYREFKYDEVTRLYNESELLLEAASAGYALDHNGIPMPDFIEARNVAKVLTEYERFKAELLQLTPDTRLDDDLEFHPQAPTGSQIAKLREIKDAIRIAKETKQKFPTAFNPFTELSILGIEAHILGSLGENEEAQAAGRESWRVAEQLEVTEQMVRSTKLIGDLQTMYGNYPKAIETYTKQGMPALAQLDESNDYQFVIRIQRIRAIALMVISKNKQLNDPTVQAELTPYIKQAFTDFRKINENLEKRGQDYLENPEIAYYLLGFIGHLGKMAQQMGIQTPHDLFVEAMHPMINSRTIGAAQAFAGTVTDMELTTECAIKRRGLTILADTIASHKARKIKRQRE